MRRTDRQPISPIRHTLAPGVKALEQQDLFGGHILLVIKPMLVTGHNTHRLALDLIPLGGLVVTGIRQDLLAAVVVVCVERVAARVEQVCGDEVAGLRGAPVDDGEGEVGGWVFNGPPYVDDLVAAGHEVVGFIGQVAADARFGCAGRLVDVDLLDGLAG